MDQAPEVIQAPKNSEKPCNFQKKPKVSMQATESQEGGLTVFLNCGNPELTVRQMTGAASAEYGSHLFKKLLDASRSFNIPQMELSATAYREALLALKPSDEIEGMLLTRMLVMHDKSMDYMSLAFKDDVSVQMRDIYLNRFTKLTRLYNETLDALNKYRRKGEQRVVVSHVNVANGGQAIVGNVTQEGGRG